MSRPRIDRVRSSLRFVTLAPALLGACSAPPPAPKGPTAVQEIDARSELEKFLPLEDGTVFAYDTASESGVRGVLIVQISRPHQDRVDLRMGAKTERLQLAPDAVAYVEGGFLLKAPLGPSATWKSKTGTVRVDAMDVSVQVPAGKFDGCLRTVEETRDPGVSRSIRTVFCPHVGLTSIDVEASSDRGVEHETAVLKSFGPSVNIAPTDTTTTTTATDEQSP